tara:strand:- start:15000 stop:16361 length:1362 start_codon:yes stop_codon:yes gene_type:complete
MARYKGINIPEVISPDLGRNNDFMEFVSTFGSSMMRSWIYGMQKKETDMLKADVTLWGSAVNAATEYKEPEPVQLLLDDLNAEKKLHKDDPIRYNYLESVTNKIDARLFNLNKQEDLRNLIEDTRVKLRPLEKGDAAGYKGGALKVIEEFQEAMFQDEQYQTPLMKQKANEITEEVLYTVDGIDMMNAIDENPELEGIQLNPESYPNEQSLVKTQEALRYIQEARDIQDITGEFPKDKYQMARKFYKEALTDRKIGTASRASEQAKIHGDYVNQVYQDIEALEKKFILPENESMRSYYGKALDKMNLTTNPSKALRVSEKSYSPQRAEQVKNSVLHDLARVLEETKKLPPDLKRAIDTWAGDDYILTSPHLQEIWNKLAYWRGGTTLNKDVIKEWKFPGGEALIYGEGQGDRVQSLVMQYFETLRQIDLKHSIMFPKEEEDSGTDTDPLWGDF